jgi:hypothetical protein
VRIRVISVDGFDFHTVPHDGPEIDAVVCALGAIPEVRTEKLPGFGSWYVHVDKGKERLTIIDEPMGGIYIRWPSEMPQSDLLVEVLNKLNEMLKNF